MDINVTQYAGLAPMFYNPPLPMQNVESSIFRLKSV